MLGDIGMIHLNHAIIFTLVISHLIDHGECEDIMVEFA